MATKNPSTQPAPTGAQTGRLLNAEEKAVCEQVAAGATLDSRRAQALLAIDGGVTQIEAGRQAGLTRGQMQYSLRKFRQQGAAIFTDAAPEPVPETELEPVPDPVSEPDLTPAPEPEPVASDGGAETMVEKARKKGGKKGKKKSGKKKKGGTKERKKGQKSKSAKSSKKKKKRKSKPAKSSRKKDRKSKSGKSSKKKKKSKGAKKGSKKRKNKDKR